MSEVRDEVESCCSTPSPSSSRVPSPISIRPESFVLPPPPLKERAPGKNKAKLPYPYHAPVVRRRSGATTITILRVASLRSIARKGGLDGISTPVAVAIGPYHHDGSPQLEGMEDAKRAAQEEFCRVASLPIEAVHERILPLAGPAGMCYAGDWMVDGVDDEYLGKMLCLDGCFLLQFMASMCPDDPDAPPDQLMSMYEVHTSIDAIARDVMLLENQIPWLVLRALMELRPGVPVRRFLALMASAFDIGNNQQQEDEKPAALLQGGSGTADDTEPNPHGAGGDPPHLLGLFHRRQVGAARTQSLRVPRLSSLSTTAVELAEMGVKLSAAETNKFGDMSMAKRQWRGLGLGLFGKLSLAPLVLNDLTACWLMNMAAYEACLGATQADNFAVRSYVSVVAGLVNREEDVQELRAKGIINSAMSDMGTLGFFKWAAPDLRVGHRYYETFRVLEEYRQERWAWIAVHSFLYRNYRTIAAVLSIVGMLAGLFKTIMSLKQPQR